MTKVLTEAERRIHAMLATGKANKAIAFEIGVSEATVKAHVSRILDKLTVRSRVAATLVYLVDLPNDAARHAFLARAVAANAVASHKIGSRA